LEKQLIAWKAGLGGVVEVIATARASSARRSGGIGTGTGTGTAGEEKEGNVLEAGKREA
jgi:hypothetical protein